MWNSRQVGESTPATTAAAGNYLETPRNTPRKWKRRVRCDIAFTGESPHLSSLQLANSEKPVGCI
jgi:hypothetical protein